MESIPFRIEFNIHDLPIPLKKLRKRLLILSLRKDYGRAI